MQESIYESCLVSNRKLVHKAIAKFIELDQSKQLSASYGVIAHHYARAEEWKSACLYLQLSSEVSQRLGMHRDVVLDNYKNLKKYIFYNSNFCQGFFHFYCVLDLLLVKESLLYALS